MFPLSAQLLCARCCRLCNLAQSVMITLPFTVGVYMVRVFVGPTGTEQQVGQLAGILVSGDLATPEPRPCTPPQQPPRHT